MRDIELLAPARDASVAAAAIAAGADALYIGPASHGARAAAGNSLDDIAAVVARAHRYGVRVYATVNTLVYDHEIPQVRQLAWGLYRAGVDALIVQDMSLLEMEMPPIDLHASTQCDIRDGDKAMFLRSAGFSRVVVAREMGLDQIAELSARRGAPEIEAFCHGALCVSYSGDCRASLAATGRSANRGECAQLCRLKYDLVDDQGNVLARQKHLLSLRDMNRLDAVGPMLDAGVSSFKIEGRLKDAGYVANAVGAYRRALDREMARRGLAHSSHGSGKLPFAPDLAKEFNRGFTDYFLRGDRYGKGSLARFASPAFVGQVVGTVAAVKGNEVTLNLREGAEKIENGDGFTYFDGAGALQGFRVNRAEGSTLTLRSPIASLSPGTTLYRNFYKRHADDVARVLDDDKPLRTLDVSLAFRLARGGTLACLAAADERGHRVTATIPIPPAQPAMSPQTAQRRKLLTKTGGTIYRVKEVADLAGDVFVPASAVTALRRRALDLLDQAQRMTYRYRYRQSPNPEMSPTGQRAANVANHLARRFYEKMGVAHIEPAAEVAQTPGPQRVMTCRYCLRREMGQCLKKGGRPGAWHLQAPNISFVLDFDCKNCLMNIYTLNDNGLPLENRAKTGI